MLMIQKLVELVWFRAGCFSNKLHHQLLIHRILLKESQRKANELAHLNERKALIVERFLN